MSAALARTRNRRRPRREGVAAVEFAMVAIPFFAMMFAVLEIGLVFVVDSVLENATLEASRIVRTGRADAQNLTAAQFKTALCSQMNVFAGDCETRADVDVRVLPQFRNADPPDPIVDGVMDESALQYQPGAPGDLVLVQVWYAQPLVTPMMSQAMSRLDSGETIIRVATAFRNEPFTARTP